MRRIRKNKNLIVCPRNKQFTDLIACAANCTSRCEIYKNSISLEKLEKFIEEHPDYEIIGELMATKKTTAKEKEKTFWVIDEDNSISEVSEKEIKENPKEYLSKKIWDKPTFRYEVIVSLKRIRA